MKDMIKKFKNVGYEVIVVDDDEVSIDGVGLLELSDEVSERYESDKIKEYFEEMILNSGMEGYDKEDLIGVMKLLKDMVLFDEYKD